MPQALKEVLTGPQGAKYGALPKIALPGDDETVLRFAQELLDELKTKPIYRRDNIPVYPYEEKARIEVMEPSTFISFVDRYVACFKQKFEAKNGEPYDVVRSMNEQTAKSVLRCIDFWSELREIAEVFPVPMLLEFNKFIFTQREKHRLESRINTLMQDRFSAAEQGETTVEEIRAQLHKSPEWQANEKRQWKASTKVRYKKQSIPEFVPFVGFIKLDNGTPVFLNGLDEVRHIYDLDVEGQKFRVVKNNAKMKAMLPRDFNFVQTPPPSGRQKRKV